MEKTVSVRFTKQDIDMLKNIRIPPIHVQVATAGNMEHAVAAFRAESMTRK